VVASICIFLPTVLVLMGIAPVYERLNRSAHFRRCVGGVLCMFTGLLVTVTVRFALNVHWDLAHVALAAATLCALLLRVEVFWVVLAGAVASALML
jgi:chromate transporter